ncbi:hypothetical protein MICAC_6020002 [Microcystis aeruginosa PCC 9443]|uniref:Uncharacterized protein n=1 Tax=Microcystis aeruginosa PCC 9443 TaxID=1160281 RepID=I4GA90_MICAE|nr:hypothetical protein MICAC_6020002 [Microcystis aeruginosa PCC 9443]
MALLGLVGIMKDILMLDTVKIINSDPPAYRPPPLSKGGEGGSSLKSIFNLIITSYLDTVKIINSDPPLIPG